MKFFPLLFALLLSSIFASPEVGFLQLYNQLGEPVTPYLGEKKLTLRPIQSGQTSSGLLIPVGSHTLTLKSAEKTLIKHQLEVTHSETVTLCAISAQLSEKAQPKPQIISLDGEYSGFKIRSLSYLSHEILLSELAVTLPSGESRILTRDFPRTLKVRIDAGKEKVYEREETIPHTLLIWMIGHQKPASALIPIYTHIAPDNLREDFTFGRKRKEIKGLKTLRPLN